MTDKDQFGEGVDIPILPLRSSVLFPNSFVSVSVERENIRSMLKAAQEGGELIGVVAQKAPNIDDPGFEDLYQTGTTARIVKAFEAVDGGMHVSLCGVARFRVLHLTQTTPHLRARVHLPHDLTFDPLYIEAVVMSVKKHGSELLKLAPSFPRDASKTLERIERPGRIADFFADNMELPVFEKVLVLDLVEVGDRLERVLALLRTRLAELRVSNEIEINVKDEIHKTHREYFLRQHLTAIESELNEPLEPEQDLDELEQKVKEARLPPEAKSAADKELHQLRQMDPSSAEYSVGRTYVEWLSDLPWMERTVDSLDLRMARETLERNHFGLERVKQRLVEYLAVRKLKKDAKSPILCIVGPPGVGKTSLGQSIAETLGRAFHRVSLGGVRDDAEVRGHRRTYVGALPGRIIQGLTKVHVNNPVFVLDEIDKLSHDFRGDPASAMLEVLDPDQNHAFSDHYIEVPFDLSKVLFIATANQLESVPPALADRMEVLELPGYTHEEKQQIARRHLIPRILDAHGLDEALIEILPAALAAIVLDYTREAGVRNLERMITTVVRSVAVEVAAGRTDPTVVRKDDLFEYLGPESFYNEMAEHVTLPGIATGLTWTAAGGDILLVEATKMEGSDELMLTGQLGGVMKESAQAARAYLRARSEELGIADAFWQKSDIHIHVPAGGAPKDGPSAGITMVVALASLVTGIEVRNAVAMIGEVTLRGSVLPVGGIKDKLLGAVRVGVKEVVLPLENEKDLHEVPEEVKRKLKFHFVSRVDEAIAKSLERTPSARADRNKRPRGRL